MAGASEMLNFLQQLPLTASLKRGVLGLIRKTLLADNGDFEVAAHTADGISIFRDVHNNKSRIYRVSGMGEVEAASQTVFELLCNMELIPEWDMLYKGSKYLNFVRDASGCCEVGDIHVVYGLPGVSHFVSDRDFVLRTVRVFFPNGMHVLYSHSVGPEEPVVGDPGSMPCMIRGHMWDSGYVVVPTANGCCLNITLQVDPKGWIPTSVVNFSLEAIPLNIARIRAAIARMPPAMLQQLPELNRRQAEPAASKLPPMECYMGPAGAALYAAAAAAAAGRRSAAGSAAAEPAGSSDGCFDDEDQYSSKVRQYSRGGGADAGNGSGSWSPNSCGGSSPMVNHEAGDEFGGAAAGRAGEWGQDSRAGGDQEEEEESEWFDA